MADTEKQAEKQALIAALSWHVDEDITAIMADEPVDATQPVLPPKPTNPNPAQSAPPSGTETAIPLGASEARQAVLALAREAGSLAALQEAIEAFDGLALTKTAGHTVFASGKPGAAVMVIGDAPGSDEDRSGTAFDGPAGALMDKMLGAIGLSRNAEAPEQAAYLSYILNWRPPGNRSPGPAEIQACLPFIEKHIALARPSYLILTGSEASKALLGLSGSPSRLRGKRYEYKPVTPGLFDSAPEPIPAIVLYHPEYLLQTPAQKLAAWEDLQMLQKLMTGEPGA